MDECLELFNQRMTEVANAGKTINMAHWVQCYAFDVIAYLTYSKRFGFLDTGLDVDSLIAMLEDVLRYSTLIGVYARKLSTLGCIERFGVPQRLAHRLLRTGIVDEHSISSLRTSEQRTSCALGEV